jgi:hypothetical protein
MIPSPRGFVYVNPVVGSTPVMSACARRAIGERYDAAPYRVETSDLAAAARVGRERFPSVANVFG